jgi:O-antigen ligase
MRTDAHSGALGWLLAALVFSLSLGALVELESVGGLAIRPYLPLLVLAAIVIAARAVRRGYLPPAPAKASFPALGVLVIAALLSIFNAEYVGEAVKQAVFLTGMAGIYASLLLAELDDRDLWRIMLAVIWSLVAAVGFGFLQFVREYANSGSLVSAFVQFHSFFRERNEFGLFMVYAAGFLIPLALNDNAPVRYKVLLILTTLTLLLNFSRGSLLALAGMVVIDRLGTGRLFAPRRAGRSLLVLGGLSFAAAAGVVILVPALAGLPELLDVLTTRSVGFRPSGDETTSIRLLFVQTAVRAFLAHPLIGSGIGNVGFVLNHFGRGADFGTVTLHGAVQPPRYDLGTTSNLLADLLLEIGLLGLLSFVVFLGAVARASFTRARGQGRVGLVHTGALLSLAGVLINGLSYNSLYLPFTWVALALGPLAATRLESTGTPAPRSAAPAPVA